MAFLNKLLVKCGKQFVDLHSEASVRFFFILGGSRGHLISTQIVLVKLGQYDVSWNNP
jgi:hypothetical protein